MRRILNFVKEIFYPKRCIFCKAYIDNLNDNILCCSDCERKLIDVKTITDKTNTRCLSASVYADNMRLAIHRFKFRGRIQYAKTLAYFLHRAVENEDAFDLITWAPTSTLRRLKRGYDQSKLLANALGKRMGVPVKRGLIKFKHTKRQSELSADRRFENVRGKYRACSDAIMHKRILIVDDVRTTGATINECVDILLRGGASECIAVTVARTEKNRKKSV